MIDSESILAGLRSGATELTQEVQRLPAEAATWQPTAGEWSQLECLTHLWIAERFVFLPRLRAMATQDNPFLPLVDEVAMQKQYLNLDTTREQLLADFLADRQAELELLEQADWARPGVHETNGPLDIAWVAQYAMAHTWEHLSQMVRVRLRHTLSQRPE